MLRTLIPQQRLLGEPLDIGALRAPHRRLGPHVVGDVFTRPPVPELPLVQRPGFGLLGVPGVLQLREPTQDLDLPCTPA
ncbi:hypothetical protein [Streptomyces sp. NPDC050704]|uniref:hypothetical protein n=1 Tax=Streptomyces sp. NPDC050704 TaxID=3157219 RepID=UPI00341FDD35